VNGERILLGITGGIAAYKCPELVRQLTRAGADVRVVMTAAAQHFVTATTLQAVSGNPVRSDVWDASAEQAMSHIELARWATRILVAPASADFMARLAGGHANDLLSTLCLATEAPIALAPAMNRVMWSNAATQANLAVLSARGLRILGPASGEQACGEVGEGRMLEPEQILEALAEKSGAWAGRRVLITAGPTYEDIDPVRYIGNRSSGKMGFALAAAAAAQGAQVVLVSGPVALATPAGVQRIDVRSAAQMHRAVFEHLPGTDTFIAAAAVADYRSAETSAQKIKKTDADIALRLQRTADILADVAESSHRPRRVIGFAAETEHALAYAQAKMASKKLDAIVMNDVSSAAIGFDSDSNAVTVLMGNRQCDIACAPKTQVAREILEVLLKWDSKAP